MGKNAARRSAIKSRQGRHTKQTTVCALLAILALCWPVATKAQTIQVDATPSHVVNTFSPPYALGSTVDRVPSNATDPFFKPEAIQKILSAGWGAISYRQNTDLFVQAWHWNPKGTWSDPAGKGYFTGDANPTEMIRHSYGYALQHRGFTRNGGLEDELYSRLNDGDLNTYWKSNPYLTQPFTNEDDTLHPQWIVIDLESKQTVNAIRIAWAEPYARVYEVQYWDGTGDAMDEQASGEWKRFASGAVARGKGGTVTLRLDSSGVSARWVRVLMSKSSNTCDTHGSADRRNCVGYAIKEVYLGTLDDKGQLKDLLRHLQRPEPVRDVLLLRGSVARTQRPFRRARSDGIRRSARLRSVLYQRHYARHARHHSRGHALRHAGGFRRRNCIRREARLSDRLRGNGRGTRWPVHDSGRLWRVVLAVGHSASRRRSEIKTRRPCLSGSHGRHQGLERCAWSRFVVRPIPRLSERSPTPF